jgi:hypothetical protein
MNGSYLVKAAKTLFGLAKSVRRRIIAPFSTAAVVIVAVLAERAHANTINIVIDPGPPGLVAGDITGLVFNNLDGIALNGQAQSLNLIFAGGRWVATRSQWFEIGLSLSTDAGTYPGFMQGSGYVFDSANNAVGSSSFGSSASSSGGMNCGVFPGTSLLDPVIFYGVHFDLIFPLNPSVSVTGATLNLWDDTASNPFNINRIPDVPDAPSTLLLLGLALASLALICKRPRIAGKGVIR